MRKFIAFLLIAFLSTSLFATNKQQSISSNIGIVANSVAFEYKINDNTQISIPVGINILDYYEDQIPPMYAGLLVEHNLNENIPNETKLQLKVGYGLAYLYNYSELIGDDMFKHAFVPLLTGQLELIVSPNHSLYVRSTPPLAMFSYEDGINVDFIGSSNLFEYIRTFEAFSILTFSIGYRYTFD
jgi:hypothetical protein